MAFEPSSRMVVLIIVTLAAVLCTVFSFVCLGNDEVVAALTVSVTAISLSGVGIVVITFFLTRNKSLPPPSVVLHHVRPSTSNIPDRPPLPPYPPSFVPPFPIPPPQLIGEPTMMVRNPPSYEESAEIEDRRITENSNAPPAYNRTNYVSDNNIASFSPPPFYSPPSPFFGTSVQTSTIYLSAENVMESPSPSASSSPVVQFRAPSPVRRHPARKPRRSSRQAQTVIVIDQEQSEGVGAEVGASTSEAPKSPTRTSLPQMFIDCSKAEPTLFTINGEESII